MKTLRTPILILEENLNQRNQISVKPFINGKSKQENLNYLLKEEFNTIRVGRLGNR